METEIIRENIVKNGCSGGCCECFTLPLSFEDILAAKNELEFRELNPTKEFKPIVKFNQSIHYPVKQNDYDKLLDMLIPLGLSEIDPQTNENLTEKYLNNKSFIEDYVLNRVKDGNLIKDGKVKVHTYTCKYFDKENKICTNYENRPNICKNFGQQCSYKGCNYANNLLELTELADYEFDLKNHDWYYMMSDDSSVYEQGRKYQENLLIFAKSKTSNKFINLFNEYLNKVKL